MGDEEEGSWDQTIDEWLCQEGYCFAGGLAQCEDGAFYAAAPVADEAGWGHIYADDHVQEIEQEDGSTKKMTINEATALKAVIDNQKAPASGLWLGGHKYRIVQSDKAFESGDYTFVWVFASRPKMGVHMVSTGSQIVCAFYNEEKGQNSGNCKKTVLAFAEYLKGIGY